MSELNNEIIKILHHVAGSLGDKFILQTNNTSFRFLRRTQQYKPRLNHIGKGYRVRNYVL